MSKEEFKKIRLAMGATQADIAMILFKHPMTISKIERGILKPFDLEHMVHQVFVNGLFAKAMMKKLNTTRHERLKTAEFFNPGAE